MELAINLFSRSIDCWLVGRVSVSSAETFTGILYRRVVLINYETALLLSFLPSAWTFDSDRTYGFWRFLWENKITSIYAAPDDIWRLTPSYSKQSVAG